MPLFNMDKELEITLDEFNKKKRHVIVMTEAGKPVYTRYGEEAEISPIVATLSVIVNKLRNIRGDGNNLELKRIENTHGKTLIFLKYRMFLIYITKDKRDNDFLIAQLADLIFHHVMSV